MWKEGIGKGLLGSVQCPGGGGGWELEGEEG